MQLKGLVKFFTGALILISLYQLSFTFLVRNVEQKAKARARTQAARMMPGADKVTMDSLTDARYDVITDSLLGKKVVNMLFKKYTYQEAKSQELNLGLDLQGGMNVTLDVSLEELLRSMSNNPGDPALNAAIAEATRQKSTSQTSYVTLFRQAWERNNTARRLAPLFTKPGVDDLKLTSSDDEVIRKIRREADAAINSTYSILQKRIDKFGVSQPTINLDNNRGVITVELAGVRDPSRVRDLLQATARLQFWEMYDQPMNDQFEKADAALARFLAGDTTVANVPVVDTNNVDSPIASVPVIDSPKATAATPLKTLFSAQPTQETFDRAAIGYIRKYDLERFNKYMSYEVVKNRLPGNAKFMVGAESRETQFNNNAVLPVYVVKTVPGSADAKLEGDKVVDAGSNTDPTSGRFVVNMRMNSEGSRIWKNMTAANIKKHVAVSLDDRVYSAPVVQGVIEGGQTQISGNFDAETANDLANILKVGKLPAPARIVQEQVVGPTLGQENIIAGGNSLIVSFIVIFLLMLVYYNTAGLVANIALILNLLFTVGILSALGATLTMPGIAGLVLTIGMAVDTNVIIFERIKEELAGGKSYQQAVSDGYKRSYAPVLDGHITQLLTAVILFVAGLGPVKGFATTQILGLLLSLYCGILVSRLITDIRMSKGKHFQYFTGLSKRVFQKAHFRFIEWRKYAYVISFIVLALGIASYFNGYDKGVEFAGGRSYNIHLPAKHSTSEVSAKMEKYFGVRPVVKTIGTANALNLTTTYLIEDQRKEASVLVQQKMHQGMMAEGLVARNVSFAEFAKTYVQGEQTVLPTISKTLQQDAIRATLFALLAIFLYILIRFRKWQYSLGTIIALLHDVCITLAVFSFLRGKVPFALELDQHFIAAILTVIGFSMNDTIIVFDRVREYFRKNVGMGKKEVINRAINDTLSRTIMTSLTVFLTVLILFIFGGEATRGFAFAMLIGVITGTYSSIFVAAPILVDMDRGDSLKNEVDRESVVAELKKTA